MPDLSHFSPYLGLVLGHPFTSLLGIALVFTALLLLVMLIVFILQNLTRVEVHYLGLAGSLPVGMALLIAAVGAGVLVAIAGGARVTQLRRRVRRARHVPIPVPDASAASLDHRTG